MNPRLHAITRQAATTQEQVKNMNLDKTRLLHVIFFRLVNGDRTTRSIPVYVVKNQDRALDLLNETNNFLASDSDSCILYYRTITTDYLYTDIY